MILSYAAALEDAPDKVLRLAKVGSLGSGKTTAALPFNPTTVSGFPYFTGGASYLRAVDCLTGAVLATYSTSHTWHRIVPSCYDEDNNISYLIGLDQTSATFYLFSYNHATAVFTLLHGVATTEGSAYSLVNSSSLKLSSDKTCVYGFVAAVDTAWPGASWIKFIYTIGTDTYTGSLSSIELINGSIPYSLYLGNIYEDTDYLYFPYTYAGAGSAYRIVVSRKAKVGGAEQTVYLEATAEMAYYPRVHHTDNASAVCLTYNYSDRFFLIDEVNGISTNYGADEVSTLCELTGATSPPYYFAVWKKILKYSGSAWTYATIKDSSQYSPNPPNLFPFGTKVGYALNDGTLYIVAKHIVDIG